MAPTFPGSETLQSIPQTVVLFNDKKYINLEEMKMRQKSALVLCLFYVLSVIGIAVSMHFCGDNLSSVSLAGSAKCSVCGAEKVAANKTSKADHCCKTTSLEVKVKDSHQGVSKVSLPENYSISLFLGPIVSQFIAAIFPRTLSMLAGKAPPLSARQALYIFNCVYRN